MTSEENDSSPTDTTSHRPVGGPITIRVGSAAFTATLLTNATATAFRARLPMTVAMSELNGNEKLYRFANDLPTKPANPGTIQTGDLMLYGANTLVLFYQTFPTSYSYTRLGRIDNPSGLAAALGTGTVTVTFEQE
ncbi:cyclophilin-like fold protein [Spirosoma horti]